MRYPLFGLGYKGKSPNVTAQTRINCYAEIQKEEDKTKVAYYNLPGCEEFADLGAAPARAQWTLSVSTYLYSVNGDKFYQVDNAGVSTLRGTINTTTGYVCMTDNGTEILIVDGVNGYIFNTSTNVFQQVFSSFPNGAATCTFLGGRFCVEVPNTGLFQYSDLYDGLTWPSANVASAEQSPDNLVAVFVDRGQLFLMGDKTTEFWATTSNADQPFALVQGAVIEWGIAAKASITKYNNATVWLARNRLGEVQVVQLTGYTAIPITGQEIGYIINQYFVVEDAISFAYMVNEHPMYQINFPNADVSWVYDQSTTAWQQASTDYGRHLAVTATNFVNKTRVADYRNGKIYTFDPSHYTDGGEVIRRQIRGRHAFDQYPISMNEVWFDMGTGVANPSGDGSDPQLMVRCSKDGGNSWSSERWVSTGKEGQFQKRASIRRWGTARSDWVFEINYAEPTPFVIVGAWVEAGD
jgi:hypothetical protein